MEELAGYYLLMSRKLTQMQTFLGIPAPTANPSISQTPPPPRPPPEPTRTDLSLPIDPPPPAAVPTADPSAAESFRPPPLAPVDRTMEQPQIEESPLPASLLIPAGETPPLHEDLPLPPDPIHTAPVGETPPLPEDPNTWVDIL